MLPMKNFYLEKVVPQLKSRFNYENTMQTPRIDKIVLNIGVGEAATNKKALESATADLAAITGQKPVITLARKSIANFKIREGWPLGCKVTLRGQRMYDFLDRLINIAIPRTRDFRGYSAKSFDSQCNYSFSIKEQIIFPEIDYDKVDALRGMDITIVTTAKTRIEAFELLRAFRFPFKESEVSEVQSG